MFYTTLGQGSRAVEVGLDYLRRVGIDWSPHPTEDEARRDYEQVLSLLGSRTIDELIELPLMSDPASLATMDVLNKMETPGARVHKNAKLRSLVVLLAVKLTLERGNCDGSSLAYAAAGDRCRRTLRRVSDRAQTRSRGVSSWSNDAD